MSFGSPHSINLELLLVIFLHCLSLFSLLYDYVRQARAQIVINLGHLFTNLC